VIDSLAEPLRERLRSLKLTDLWALLFRCEPEELSSVGGGAYRFPDFDPPFYVGTQGVETAFMFAGKSLGTGSSDFRNIREGNWVLSAMSDRLLQSTELIPLECFFQRICDRAGDLRRFLVPKYLDRIDRAVNLSAHSTICERMSPFVQQGEYFVQSLAATSISFFTPVRNAPLVHAQLISQFAGAVNRADACMAAGFPHFSTGLMRSWGRETFIALRGLFLVTEHCAEARDQLVAFAARLRDGVIPNLHDGCLNPHCDARDATSGASGRRLHEWRRGMSSSSGFGGCSRPTFRTSARVFASSDRPIVSMADVVQEILTKDANGIHFREWNTGQKLDSGMCPEGFIL
jgi:glycogen debranching enzyme